MDDADDPVEGSNVTLVCRSHMMSSPPEWAYLNRYTQQLHELDETSPPEGKTSPRHNPSRRRIFIRKISLLDRIGCYVITGIQITTRKLKVFGQEPFYESQLRLTNITSNSKTTFHCQSKNDDEILSRQISFKVNGNYPQATGSHKRSSNLILM